MPLGSRRVKTPTQEDSAILDSPKPCQPNVTSYMGISNRKLLSPIKAKRSEDSQVITTSEKCSVNAGESNRPLSFEDCVSQSFSQPLKFSCVGSFINLIRMCDGDLDNAIYWSRRLGDPKDVVDKVAAIFRQCFLDGMCIESKNLPR